MTAEKPDYKITILCNCSRTHTYEEWQACPMALTPRPLAPWWRKKEKQNDQPR